MSEMDRSGPPPARIIHLLDQADGGECLERRRYLDQGDRESGSGQAHERCERHGYHGNPHAERLLIISHVHFISIDTFFAAISAPTRSSKETDLKLKETAETSGDTAYIVEGLKLEEEQ